MNVTQLVEQLHTGNPMERRAAAETLCLDQEMAAEAIPALVRYCGDDDRTVAEYCVASMEELGPPSDAQLAEIAELARSTNPEIVYWASTFLGRAGEAAASQAALLGSIVASDLEPYARRRAAWAIGKLGKSGATQAAQLESATNSSDPALARTARQVLETFERCIHTISWR